MILPFVQGFGIGGGLIVAIGAQNAFVLSQGARRNHHLIIALICSICDALLIGAGVLGLGALVAESPMLSQGAALGGICFLLWFGLRSLRSAWRGGALELDDKRLSLRAAILTTLAVTILNPHVYLDTLVFTGSIASQYPLPERYLFGAGAITASLVWFYALSLGGQLLAPLLTRPAAWRVLDTVIGLVMFSIAGSLALTLAESLTLL